MSTSTMSRAAGFTLLELLTGLAVSSVVLLAVAGTVIGQSQAYEINLRTREVVGSARRGLGFIESKVKLAGFGIEPQFAFAFEANSDRIDGPDTLIVRYRDPMFRRRGVVVGNTLTLSAPLIGALRANQILLLICPDGSRPTYVTVADPGALTGATDVTLAPYGASFPDMTPAECILNDGAETRPWVVKVDEYQFSVDANVLVMTRRGSDPVPVIADVEDFQVAYVMNRPQADWFAPAPLPDAPDLVDLNWVFGDAPNTVEIPDATDPAPALEDGYRAGSRFTGNPANTRGVRISLVTRSNPQRPFLAGQRRPALENRPEDPNTDGLFRGVVSTQVAVPNMASRSMFAPMAANQGGG